MRWPNHLVLWRSMCCRTGVVPTVSLMTSFLIISLLVLFAALLRHLISQVTSFLSRAFVRVHVWHWYVSVGKNMALMIFALTLCRHRGKWRKNLCRHKQIGGNQEEMSGFSKT